MQNLALWSKVKRNRVAFLSNGWNERNKWVHSRVQSYIHIHDSRFRKNYALISHERKRRILLFKSPPIHEFETTIRNIVFIVTINCIYYFIHFYKTSRCRRKVKRLIYKQPSILPIENSFRLENFVNITRTNSPSTHRTTNPP